MLELYSNLNGINFMTDADAKRFPVLVEFVSDKFLNGGTSAVLNAFEGCTPLLAAAVALTVHGQLTTDREKERFTQLIARHS